MESDAEEYIKKFSVNSFSEYMPLIGVVEDNIDNLRIGRVRIRCFGVHPEDRTEVPTEHLPWAIVAQPTTSSSISGLGWSPNGLELGTWVIGYFADGKTAMYPIVTHTLPGIHRPNPPNVPGGPSSGYISPGSYDSGGAGSNPETQRPYHNEVVEAPGQTIGPSSPNSSTRDATLAPAPNGTAYGTNAAISGGNADMILTLDNKDSWDSLGLKTYSYKAAPDGYACKDGQGSLKFHYGTALAFENLTKDFGKGKLFINSAYRTPAYNASVGGAPHSQHMVGRALDVSLDSIGRSREEILKYAKLAVKNGFVGFGLYPTFLHSDTGTGRLWNGASAQWFKDGITEAGWYPGKKGLTDVKVNAGASANSAAATAVNNSGSIGALNPGSTAGQISADLKSKGYSDSQIAAVLASAKGESGLNPNSYNPNDNGSPSYGLFQWHGDRLTGSNGLYSWSKANGYDSSTVSGQMAYFNYEQANRASGAQLQSASTVYDANKAMANYEVYSGYNDPNSSQFQQRLAVANGYYTGTQYAETASGPTKGFVDPTNSLPFTEYRGNPSTHVNARGFNSNLEQSKLFAKDDGRMTGIPAAGDIGTFGEPELAAAPQYPYNTTYATKSGHLMEFDDTPGSERINIEHKSGTGIEMFTDGSLVERSKGNHYVTDFGDSYQGVIGKYFLSSVNDMHIRSTADMIQHVDGSLKMVVGNDGLLTISGDYTIAIGEDLKLRTGGRLVIEAAGIDFISSADINIEAKGGINMKSKTLNIDASGNVDIKAVEVHLDDIVHVGEGLAKGNAGADTSDVGLPPARTVINKDNLKSTTNQTKVTTTEEAADHYAGSS